MDGGAPGNGLDGTTDARIGEGVHRWQQQRRDKRAKQRGAIDHKGNHAQSRSGDGVSTT
jgi:hypothetical protein